MESFVAIIMGSKNDWQDVMKHAALTLADFDIKVESRVLSAHRTPKELEAYLADATKRGLKLIIAGAGGAAHLAGVIAAQTVLPVLAVPIDATSLQGLDALLSMVQMPAGIPVGTLGIGKSGAINAALLATSILGLQDNGKLQAIEEYRKLKAEKVLGEKLEAL